MNSDVIYAGDGNDFVSGRISPAQGDRIYVGAGNDRIYLADSSCVIDGGEGYDTVDRLDVRPLSAGVVLSDTSTYRWMRNIEHLTNSRLTDHGDVVRATVGGIRYTELNAGLGNDLLLFNGSSLRFGIEARTTYIFSREGLGEDESQIAIFTGFSFERMNLVATAFNDRCVGLAGNDTIRGLAGHDTLQGGAGIDRLYGGSGDDLILAGAGNDSLTGGSGEDVFVYLGDTPIHGFATPSGRDVITDFNPTEDIIVFMDSRRPLGLTISNQGDDRFITWSNGSILLTSKADERIDIFAASWIEDYL